MIIKFFYKNIKISNKKLKIFIRKIKNLQLYNLLIYLNFFNNKFSFIFKKLILNLINIIKLKFKNFNLNLIDRFIINSGKGICFKRLFYRSKGICNIKKKYYSNIVFFLYFKNGSKG